jgi:prepilin-type N-terminal cleavage/methylation domain-containing protein
VPAARHPRRGVTLIEMLVVVALLVLMMTIIVQIFQAATGSVTAAKVYSQLDDSLRELDATIRTDLQGATAHFTPPLDPADDLGYFEYIENTWADAQGEDSDDCLRFTAQAPAGQPFTGRMYLYPPAGTAPGANIQTVALSQPVLITSEFAEIIYFVRNGNLYRRVLLVVPDRQSAVNFVFTASNNLANVQNGTAASFGTYLFNPAGSTVSWLGVNDLSARPSPRGPLVAPILNTLGDLTNRENRAFTPRFCDDYDGNGIPDDYNLATNQATTSLNGTAFGDGVPDYYPTLYPNVFNLTAPPNNVTSLVNIAGVNYPAGTPTYQNLAFPFIFPGAYSKPDPVALKNPTLGWIHSLDPSGNSLNHAPLDLGDNLPAPSSPQTWWGFPTWRETMSAAWFDPTKQLTAAASATVASGGGGSTTVSATAGQQAVGLQPFLPQNGIVATGTAGQNLLPAAINWFNPPLYNDGASGVGGYGLNSAFSGVYTTPALWDDDLIMTGVRSFDVKALDNSTASYVDLGNSPNNVGPTLANPVLNQLVLNIGGTNVNFTTQGFPSATVGLNVVSSSLAHEGIMPPRGAGLNPSGAADFRFDPQALAKGIFIPIGDDFASTIRLRRTYDTWSTEYTQAPATGFDPSTQGFPPYGLNIYPPNSGLNANATVILNNPVYPSYPAPYPVPLRGIQIQIRVVDPRNERVKVLTIRQDFSDKIANHP